MSKENWKYFFLVQEGGDKNRVKMVMLFFNFVSARGAEYREYGNLKFDCKRQEAGWNFAPSQQSRTKRNEFYATMQFFEIGLWLLDFVFVFSAKE